MDTMTFNKSRLKAANVSELYGLCLGILADGYVDDSEIAFLLDWVKARPHLLRDPVVSEMMSIILRALEKGGDDSQNSILEALLSFTGSPIPDKEHSSVPSGLPLCEVIPDIEQKGCVFCCTGTFDLGSRGDCQKLIEQAGGLFSKGVTKKVDYLVIGNKVTPDWKQQSYGAKIIKAMEYRDSSNVSISIITEKDFIKVLDALKAMESRDA